MTGAPTSARGREGRQRLLITGGASGIGRAVAQSGVDAGWEVIVLDRDLADVGRGVQVDLSDPAATAAALTTVIDDGPITRLVNNVGAVFPARLEDQTLQQVHASYELNLRTAVQCTQAVVEGMRQSSFGRIVNVTSRAALGKAERTAYAAAKAGLIGLTRVWALELGAAGITVNAIGPGPIATELFLAANPADSPATRAIVAGVPVGRLGTAADVAHAIAFMLDDRSSFVTGQTLYVCGGLTVGTAPF